MPSSSALAEHLEAHRTGLAARLASELAADDRDKVPALLHELVLHLRGDGAASVRPKVSVETSAAVQRAVFLLARTAPSGASDALDAVADFFLKRATDARAGSALPADLHAAAERAELLGELFEQAPALIAHLSGPTHIFDMANAGYLAVVGNRPIIGKPVREALPELEGQPFFDLLDRVYATGEPLTFSEVPAQVDRHGDGTLSELLIDFVYQPTRGSNGQVNGILVHCVEVTEKAALRKKVEAAHQASQISEAWLSAVLVSMGDAVMATDAEGKTTFINPVGEELTGWSRAEAAGVPLEQVFRIVNESTRKVVESPVTRALREGRVVGLANHTVLIRKDGSERAIDDSAAPIRDGAGKITGAVLVFRDVTPKKLAEREKLARTRESELAAAVGRALTGAGSLRDQLQRCVQAVVTGLDVAFARVWSLAPGSDTLELQASAGLYTHLDGAHARVKVGTFKIGRIAASRRPHLSNAVPTDPEVGDPEWARREGMVAFAGYPLLVGGHTVGVLGLFARQALNEKTLHALAAIADQVALGIERGFKDAALRESERHLRDVVAATGVGSVVVDPVTMTPRADARMHELAGFTPDEPLNMEIGASRIHPEDRERVLAAFGAALQGAGGGTYHSIYRTVEPVSQRERWLEARGELIPSRDGEPARFVATAIDITSRRLLELERERAYEILDSGEPAFVIDREDRFVWVNRAYARMVFKSPAELIGTPVWAISPRWVAENPQLAEQTHLSMRDRAPRTFETHVARLDAWVELSLNPIADGTLAVFVRDITARKQAERRDVLLADAGLALASSLDLDAALKAITRVAVPALADWCVIDLVEDDGSLRRTAVAGPPSTPVEVLERIRAQHPLQHAEAPATRALRNRATVLLQLDEEGLRQIAHSEAHLAALEKLDVNSSLSVPMLVQGRALGVLNFGQTVSGGRRFTESDIPLAEELALRCALALENANHFRHAEEANRLKDDFLATVSHELRTPLTSILGWVQMLRAAPLSPERQARGLETIERNARAQARLIDDLLDVSRVVAGKLRLELARLPLDEILTVAMETLRPSAEARGVNLIYRAERPATVRGDPQRLQQVVSNLLTNAIKFTPAGGQVLLQMATQGDQVQVLVRDTGEGIAPAFLPHVFERFRQAQSGSDRAHGGLGLGLAIVRNLVELHGGSVRAESAGPGQGSTFTVTLPLATGAAAVTGESTADRGVDLPTELQGTHVLVIDDEPDVRELVQALLERCGAHATLAEDARSGLEALRRHRPDAVVSDVAMPGADGFDLIRKVRQLSEEEGGQTPVIALTALSSADDRRRIIRAGFTMHVPKPIDPSELLVVLAAVVGKRRSTA